jgi:hypothetical protein
VALGFKSQKRTERDGVRLLSFAAQFVQRRELLIALHQESIEREVRHFAGECLCCTAPQRYNRPSVEIWLDLKEQSNLKHVEN